MRIYISYSETTRTPMIQLGWFGVPTKQVKLIKICVNIMRSRVLLGAYLWNYFTILNGLKRDASPFELCFGMCS
jgi:hypothetical protein